MFNKKGFLFIEGSLMMTIAITGILSAALFPSLTSYLARGRDTSRMAGINEITTAIELYKKDNNSYPKPPSSGCIPSKDLIKYLPKIPTDPIQGRITSGCDGSDGMTYAYRVFRDTLGKDNFIIATELERINGGNSEFNIDEIMKLQDPSSKLDTLRKGDGNYYIIRN